MVLKGYRSILDAMKSYASDVVEQQVTDIEVNYAIFGAHYRNYLNITKEWLLHTECDFGL